MINSTPLIEKMIVNSMSESYKPWNGAKSVAIMQPYFFPYLGYFALIKHTDFFVVFDSVQYIRKGWMNRNRILKPVDGWQYITAPVKGASRETLIKDIYVVDGNDWKKQILRQLEHYKKKAVFYDDIISLLENCFLYDSDNISYINIYFIQQICKYLGIDFNYEFYSKMNLDIDVNMILAPDEWALNICKKMNINTYYNSPGGVDFFDYKKYSRDNIDLNFIDINIEEYSQGRSVFEKGLSILDVLMFNSPEKIVEMLNNVKVIKH